jgi:cell fate regulator YaaT (PSP1 superfamily)
MNVVTVRLASSLHARACDPAAVSLEVGDRCIVDTEAGAEFGTVVSPPLDNPFYPAAGVKLPRVVRLATVDDEEAFAHKAAAEKEAGDYCRQCIRERGLAMRLGKVDRQLDGRRMTFHFTAETRVDFRDLVRDLTAKFQTRIELRQVGDREDAGMRGGCGPCGKTLCCSTFLRRFEPISIKMAKSQGLSLNPSKISGMCGRLMCCLKYEYDPSARPVKRGGAPPAEGPPPSGLPVVS